MAGDSCEMLCEHSLPLPGSLLSLSSFPSLLLLLEGEEVERRTSSCQVPTLILLAPQFMRVRLNTHLELQGRNIPVPFHRLPCTPCSRHTPQLPLCSWLTCCRTTADLQGTPERRLHLLDTNESLLCNPTRHDNGYRYWVEKLVGFCLVCFFSN